MVVQSETGSHTFLICHWNRKLASPRRIWLIYFSRFLGTFWVCVILLRRVTMYTVHIAFAFQFNFTFLWNFFHSISKGVTCTRSNFLFLGGNWKTKHAGWSTAFITMVTIVWQCHQVLAYSAELQTSSTALFWTQPASHSCCIKQSHSSSSQRLTQQQIHWPHIFNFNCVLIKTPPSEFPMSIEKCRSGERHSHCSNWLCYLCKKWATFHLLWCSQPFGLFVFVLLVWANWGNWTWNCEKN